MRSVLAVAALALTGCASTVYRLEGAETTPSGPARSPCESKDWLVIAPTRAEITDAKKGTSHPETGLGLYRVGSNDPEPIPDIEQLPASEMVEKKRKALSPYHTRQVVAGGLGAAGLVAIAIGTVVFVNAFGSKTVTDPVTGARKEENPIDGTQAAVGGITVGGGFALGIAGLIVNPSHAERTQASATRYVFLDPPDSAKSVEGLVGKHDDGIRQRCEASPH